MRDRLAEAYRWLRPTRYPNGLAGGVPFEAFGESQAVAALTAAERFVEVARAEVRPA
jgi:HEPN domain-containing protein